MEHLPIICVRVHIILVSWNSAKVLSRRQHTSWLLRRSFLGEQQQPVMPEPSVATLLSLRLQLVTSGPVEAGEEVGGCCFLLFSPLLHFHSLETQQPVVAQSHLHQSRH